MGVTFDGEGIKIWWGGGTVSAQNYGNVSAQEELKKISSFKFK